VSDDAAGMAKRGPLNDIHEAAGAKFAEFGGWLMPLEYAGGGVLAEHAAVREAVGVFDVSHMGTLQLHGPGATEALNRVLTNDLSKVDVGQAQYSLLCDEFGGVVDDLLVYVRSDDSAMIVPNAANTAAVRDALVAALAVAAPDVVVSDVSDQTAIIAIQGPSSAEVISQLELPLDLTYMSFADLPEDSLEIPSVIARSGYTGEQGYELIVPAEHAVHIWEQIITAVSALGGRVCGLGARDTLRTEVGYPLHGHELSTEIDPVTAGLSWAVGWEKTEFVGRGALLERRAAGPARRLRGLRLIDRGVPRAGMVVRKLSGDSPEIGTVTSGTFSPTLRVGIALALIDAELGVGDEVVVEIRGKGCRAEVVKPPFVESDPR